MVKEYILFSLIGLFEHQSYHVKKNGVNFLFLSSQTEFWTAWLSHRVIEISLTGAITTGSITGTLPMSNKLSWTEWKDLSNL